MHVYDTTKAGISTSLHATMLYSILSFVLLSFISSAHGKLTWGQTKFLFAFGDSYTTDGFNISAGVNSSVPGFVSQLEVH